MSTGILFLLLNVAKLVDFVSTYEFENPKKLCSLLYRLFFAEVR